MSNVRERWAKLRTNYKQNPIGCIKSIFERQRAYYILVNQVFMT